MSFTSENKNVLLPTDRKTRRNKSYSAHLGRIYRFRNLLSLATAIYYQMLVLLSSVFYNFNHLFLPQTRQLFYETTDHTNVDRLINEAGE
jgi:hypothetical protein